MLKGIFWMVVLIVLMGGGVRLLAFILFIVIGAYVTWGSNWQLKFLRPNA